MRNVLRFVRFLPQAARVTLVSAALVSPLAVFADNADSLQKLKLEKFTLPEFPEFVRLTGTNRGVVTVAIGRDSDGYVTDVFVLSSDNPRLSQSVVSAVKEWRFATQPAAPATGKDNVPIVRFLFSAQGVSVVSAITGTLAGEKDAPAVRPDEPVIMPTFADLDAAPKALKQPMPKLSASAAERAPDGGTATVRFFVDNDGRVRVPTVVDCTTPELGKSAISAVEKWRFEPPKVAGKTTIARETISLTFKPTVR